MSPTCSNVQNGPLTRGNLPPLLLLLIDQKWSQLIWKRFERLAPYLPSLPLPSPSFKGGTAPGGKRYLSRPNDLKSDSGVSQAGCQGVIVKNFAAVSQPGNEWGGVTWLSLLLSWTNQVCKDGGLLFDIVSSAALLAFQSWSLRTSVPLFGVTVHLSHPHVTQRGWKHTGDILLLLFNVIYNLVSWLPENKSDK